MRAVAALALALVAVLAVVAPQAADALPAGKFGLRKLKQARANRKPFEPFGREWTPKNLRNLANRLGGKATFSTKFEVSKDPVAMVKRFFSTPPPAYKAVPEDKENLEMLTFDGKKLGRISLPTAAVAKFVEGVNTDGWNVEEHAEHEHPDERKSHDLVLLEEGATAGTVYTEKPDWIKIDGKKMDQHPLDSVVQMQWKNLDFCSGSVISDHLVLTAAHCLYDNNVLVDVSTGDFSVAWKRDGTSGTAVSDRRTVKRYIIQPGYKRDSLKTRENDVAILILDGAAAPHGRFGFGSNKNEAARKADMGEARLRKQGGKAYVHLTAYPGTGKKGENMWCDKCEVAAFVRDGKMAHSKCDAEPGSSGGPYWYQSEKHGATVMGVVSREDGSAGNLMAVITTPVYDQLRLALKAAGDKRPSHSG